MVFLSRRLIVKYSLQRRKDKPLTCGSLNVRCPSCLWIDLPSTCNGTPRAVLGHAKASSSMTVNESSWTDGSPFFTVRVLAQHFAEWSLCAKHHDAGRPASPWKGIKRHCEQHELSRKRSQHEPSRTRSVDVVSKILNSRCCNYMVLKDAWFRCRTFCYNSGSYFTIALLEVAKWRLQSHVLRILNAHCWLGWEPLRTCISFHGQLSTA